MSSRSLAHLATPPQSLTPRREPTASGQPQRAGFTPAPASSASFSGMLSGAMPKLTPPLVPLVPTQGISSAGDLPAAPTPSRWASILLVTACGSTTSASTLPVQITLTDFHIASTVTSFTPGVPYQFIITNKGKVAHEFMIMPKNEGDMRIMPMSQMDKLALAKVENIKPGTTVRLNYTFPSSTASSHPQFACYYPGHYMAGMKLGVAVTS